MELTAGHSKVRREGYRGSRKRWTRGEFMRYGPTRREVECDVMVHQRSRDGGFPEDLLIERSVS